MPQFPILPIPETFVSYYTETLMISKTENVGSWWS